MSYRVVSCHVVSCNVISSHLISSHDHFFESPRHICPILQSSFPSARCWTSQMDPSWPAFASAPSDVYGGRRLRRLLQLAGRGPRIICLESNKEDLKVGKDVLKPWVKASLRCFGPKVLHVLGSPNLERKIISMVSGEPFAKECEGLPCDCQFWHHWAQVDALRFALKSSCIFLPRAFRVKAALLGCRDLWRRRQRISGPVQGVDVSAINELHPDVPVPQRFPCSLWQVEHAILSEAVTLCSIDMEMPFPDSQEFPKTTLRSQSTAVDGIVTWTEVCFSSATGWIPTARIIRVSRRDACAAWVL